MAVEQKTYPLDKIFHADLSYAPYGLLVEEYTGEEGACYISRGRHGKPIFAVASGRLLSYDEPLVNLWIHNTKVQVGCELVILTATQNAIRSLVRPERVNPKSLQQRTVTVGTTAVALPSYPVPIGMEVVIVADKENEAPVYIGPEDVTTATGIRLNPGAISTMRVADSSAVYAIASVAGQKILYSIGMTSIQPEWINPESLQQGTVTVGTTAVALPSHRVPIGMEVVIVADKENEAPVYVGPEGVTTATGIRLDPGAICTMRVANSSAVYAISSMAAQKILYSIGMTSEITGIGLNPTKVVDGSVDVGTTATQFPDQAIPPGMSALIRGDGGNTDPIYIGGSTVTTLTGYYLNAFDSLNLAVDNLNKIYAIAEVVGQKARYVVEVY